MGPKPDTPKSNDLFRQRLDELINPRHPLAQLTRHIDWGSIRAQVGGLFPFQSWPSRDSAPSGGRTLVPATHLCAIG